ncbi:hypothetical protein [Streptomyces sp. NPDC050264]|uniref:hypothetical protein n=1 Tax=Streptomyces sp. NPDC050264 TaxID=3155038 RepID=UPI0034356529
MQGLPLAQHASRGPAQADWLAGWLLQPAATAQGFRHDLPEQAPDDASMTDTGEQVWRARKRMHATDEQEKGGAEKAK